MANVVDPPRIMPSWQVGPPVTALAMGVRGPLHIQTPAFVGGNSPSPMQRLGMAPMFALGVLAPDTNEAGIGIGSRRPAASSRLFEPLMTMAGAMVSSLSTSAK